MGAAAGRLRDPAGGLKPHFQASISGLSNVAELQDGRGRAGKNG